MTNLEYMIQDANATQDTDNPHFKSWIVTSKETGKRYRINIHDMNPSGLWMYASFHMNGRHVAVLPRDVRELATELTAKMRENDHANNQ